MTLRLVFVLGLGFSLACAAAPKDGAEGTAAGDCADEADNDGNGDFDCDDVGCAASPACAEGDADTDADSDSDTDADTDADTEFALVDWMYDCNDDPCVYSMTTSRPAALLELMIAETADPTSSPWEEQHDAFVLVDSSGSRHTYELELDWTTDFNEQRSNRSTLLNPDTIGASGMNGITLNMEASSEQGDFVCVVTGHDPAYYSDRCRNIE